jgi:DNA-binding GntR family transcriptional regulator
MDRRTVRLTAQVFAQLRDDIVRGVLPADTPLSEQELCGRLNVSRTPVREAFIKLAEEGLVRVYPQFGTFVAPISLEAVKVGQYVREHLECALVGDAARRVDAAGLKQISDLVERQADAKTAEAFYDLDNEFHALIADLSGNPGVWPVILRAKTQFDRVRYLTVHDPERMRQILAEHREIVAALAAGDAEKAQAALRGHLRQVFVSVAKLGLSDDPSPPPRRRRTAARAS